MSPILIQENMHKFTLSKVDREKAEKDKTPEEAAAAIRKMKIDFESRYCLYLARAMLRFQHMQCVLAPYNFG
jgi:hypothetical protein